MKNAPEQLEVVSANGVKIKLKDGSQLIDGISSWWSVAHGYNHPKIVKAITDQAKILPHVMMAGLANEQTYRLAYNLAKVTPKGLNKVFFSDSGSTAVEVAMKMAIQYHINKNQKQKTKFISFKNSYHGDTTGAMSLADMTDGMHKKFSNFLMKNYNVELPDDEKKLKKFEEFLQKNKNEVAAIFVEPLVQCAGGMKFHSAETLKAIYDLAKKYDLLFIADECATGFYRTGKYFACDHAKISPDIMTIGKALTGGYLTLAATIVKDEIYNQFLNDSLDFALMHGPTFMGNPLACAAANASLELFEKNDYTKKVVNISKILKKELEKCRSLNNVADVRVLGAIGVVELKLPKLQKNALDNLLADIDSKQNHKNDLQFIANLRKEFAKHRVWLRPFGNVIYVMPPLIIDEKNLKTITNVIHKILIQNEQS